MEIKLSGLAEKFLDKCEKELYNRISQKIEKLSLNPFPSDTVKLAGFDKIVRIRVGDYRILYKIDFSELIIIKIDKRGRVYK